MKKRKSADTGCIAEDKIKFAEKYLGMRGTWMRMRNPATIQNTFVVDSQNENVWAFFWGASGRPFKSARPDHFLLLAITFIVLWFFFAPIFNRSTC